LYPKGYRASNENT